MIWFFFAPLLYAQTFCSTPSTHPEFSQFEQKIESKIAQSANLVSIAKEADQVLSKLLKAKSPVLISWLQKRQLMTAKDVEIAQQWRKYYLENFVLSQFPTKNKSVNKSVEALFSNINEMAFDKSYVKQTESIFSEAKQSALSTLNSWNLPEKINAEVRQRVQAIKLYWFKRLQGTRYNSKPLEFLKWGVAYDPTHNEINIGIHIKKYPTKENLFAVFSHEIGHAIDPCRWGAFLTSINPFDKVLSCLRTPKSANALPRDDSQMQSVLDKKLITPEIAESLKRNPTCNRTFYPPLGTQKDQILESFADWFSAEVLAHNKKYITQSFRADLCSEQRLKPGSSYLKNKDRLNKIYLAHPAIQNKLQVTSSSTYCKY